MAERKPFLLRMEPELHEALQRWAGDELRSLNGQIEFAGGGAPAPAPRGAPHTQLSIPMGGSVP